MSLLFKIVYAAHANGTHHKLALDALNHLGTTDAENWRRVFLKYADVFLQGSKAPDTEFKDFKNHVLHVRDGYWGGAPEKAQSWYDHLVAALQSGDWETSVYAAGVLSHYVTDPIHPFHTAQTAAENNIHRAVEWSINRSYDQLRAEAVQKHDGPIVTAGSEPHWLKDLVCRGADRSNLSYEKLIAHYDIHRGVVVPPDGLDAVARAGVSELLMLAAKTVAVVLDRAIAQSGAKAPEVQLTAATVLATLKIPLKFITKKLDDAETRRQVEAMYDELIATGQVEINLPEDDRLVRDLYAKEIEAPKAAKNSEVRSVRVQPANVAAVRTLKTSAATQGLLPPAAQAAQSAVAVQRQPHAIIETAPAMATAGTAATPPAVLSQLSRTVRPALSLSDDLEAAPSIGPKMAERFAGIGVTTIGDFLAQDAGTLSSLLEGGRWTPDTLLAWQHQARLVTTIPGLTGTQAQLFTGAGFRTASDIAQASPADLSAAVMAFAVTAEGKRILRDGNPPDLERIKSVVTRAAEALAA